MSFFSWTARQSEEMVVLLDIGLGSVGGAIVRGRAGSRPEILFAVRTPYGPTSPEESDKALRTLAGVLDTLSAEVRKRNYEPRRIVTALRGPFFMHEAHVIAKRFEVEERVTSKLLSSLVGKELAGRPATVCVVEQKITRVKLNGYIVDDPLDKKATEIEIDLTLALAPCVFVEAVERQLAKAFPHAQREIHTFSFLGFTLLRDILHKESDCVSVALGEYGTEVSFLIGGALFDTVYFPVGVRSLTDAITAQLRTIPEESETTLRLYIEEKLAPEMKERVGSVIHEAEALWRAQMSSCLERVAGRALLPDTLFVISPAKMAPLFVKAVSVIDAHHITRLATSFTVQQLNRSVLSAFCVESPDVIAQGDPSYMIQAIASERIHA